MGLDYTGIDAAPDGWSDGLDTSQTDPFYNSTTGYENYGASDVMYGDGTDFTQWVSALNSGFNSSFDIFYGAEETGASPLSYVGDNSSVPSTDAPPEEKSLWGGIGEMLSKGWSEFKSMDGKAQSSILGAVGSMAAAYLSKDSREQQAKASMMSAKASQMNAQANMMRSQLEKKKYEASAGSPWGGVKMPTGLINTAQVVKQPINNQIPGSVR